MSDAAAADTTERLEGKLLDGRFLVQRRVGAGSFGSVYLADERVFNVRLRRVALKLLRREMVTPDNAAELLNDAIRLIDLQQERAYAEVAPHLVRVFGAGFLHERPDQAFVVMEYAEGYRAMAGSTIRTLHGLIRAFRPVPVDLALRWIIQILRPLAWMHTLPRPVLHCDLKPDNILACGKDNLKVADFGLAQLALGIVGTGGPAGALTCQAPETLAGTYPTPAADVYSLGLILYEMLVGSNPLADVGLEALAAKRHDEFRELQIQAREQWDGLPPFGEEHPELDDDPLLLEIVDRCLQFRASRRYDNADSLLQAVERYAEGKGIVVLSQGKKLQEQKRVSPNLDRLLAETQALLRRERIDEARLRCEEARKRFPKSAKPYRWIAKICLIRGEWREALKVCAEGRALEPDDPELLYALADAYDMAGQTGAGQRIRQNADSLAVRARQ